MKLHIFDARDKKGALKVQRASREKQLLCMSGSFFNVANTKTQEMLLLENWSQNIR